MCATTDGNGWYDTKQTKWRQPKSSVIDYFDRVIIQRQRGAVGEIYTNNTLHYASCAATTTNPVGEQNLSQRCGGDWVWQAGLLCKRWQRLDAVLHLQSHYRRLFTGVAAKLQKSTEHLYAFGEHSCGWHSGLAEAAGALAGSLEWIQSSRLVSEDGNSNVRTSNTFLRDVNYSIRNIILFFGIITIAKLYNKKVFTLCWKIPQFPSNCQELFFVEKLCLTWNNL